MAYYLHPSGFGRAIVIGAGTSSDLIAAKEYVDFRDTAVITASPIDGTSAPLAVTVQSFSVNVPAWPYLSCTSTGTTIVFSGYHSTTFRDTWVSRDTEPEDRSTTSIGVGAWPSSYYAGYSYEPDLTYATSVTWTIVTNLGTFTATQRVLNNWNRTRDYVRPFVRGGTMETLDGNFVTFYGTYTSTTTSLSVSGFTVLYGSASSSPTTVRVFLTSPYLMSTGDVITNTITSTGVNHVLANGEYFVDTASSLASTSFTFTVISPGIIETTSLSSTLTSTTIAAQNAIFDVIYNTPASTSSVSDYVTYTIPAYCSSVSFVCIGGGGQGGASRTDDLGNGYSGGGGGGGGLRYRNDYVVTSGTVLRIHVGNGGSNTLSSGKGEDGDQSFVADNAGTILLFASGGVGGAAGTSSSATSASGGGGSAITTSPPTGGGNGGAGGLNPTTAGRSGGGGGGAGGYGNIGSAASTAVGGRGGSQSVESPTDGVNGSSGGGFSDVSGVGGGGGTSLGGRGTSGSAGFSDPSGGSGYAGQGGSVDTARNSSWGGANGMYTYTGGVGSGGQYGGGGHAVRSGQFGGSPAATNGAVRLMSGGGRSFPDNALFQTSIPGNSSYTVTSGTEIVLSTPLLGSITVSTTTYNDGD